MPLHVRQISRSKEVRQPLDEESWASVIVLAPKKTDRKKYQQRVVSPLRHSFPLLGLSLFLLISYRTSLKRTTSFVERRLRLDASNTLVEKQSNNDKLNATASGRSKFTLQIPLPSSWHKTSEKQASGVTDFISKLATPSLRTSPPLRDKITSGNQAMIESNFVSKTAESNLQTSDFDGNLKPKNQSTVESDFISQEVNNTDNLKLAMLISFPNSGTSFTLSAVQKASEHHVGSTACLPKKKERKYTTIFSNTSQPGPHFQPASSRRMKQLLRPEKYILTKTHCDGYDNSPQPSPLNYIVTQSEFSKGCRKVCSPLPSRVQPDNATSWKFFHFDQSLIGSFVHLFRDPFDNIVSRWHNHLSHAPTKYPQEVGKWENSPSGFQAFCQGRDEYHQFHEAPSLPDELVKATQGVPCKTDFVRYVQWHNHAFRMTQVLQKPVHIIHYFDYRDDYNGTMYKLLNFLELPFASDGLDFHWRDYSDYFTAEQRNATIHFIKLYASPPLIKELTRYGF